MSRTMEINVTGKPLLKKALMMLHQEDIHQAIRFVIKYISEMEQPPVKDLWPPMPNFDPEYIANGITACPLCHESKEEINALHKYFIGAREYIYQTKNNLSCMGPYHLVWEQIKELEAAKERLYKIQEPLNKKYPNRGGK